MRDNKNNLKRENEMTKISPELKEMFDSYGEDYRGILEPYTLELIEVLEFNMNKETGFGMNIQDSIQAAEKQTIAGDEPWNIALTVLFGEGN